MERDEEEEKEKGGKESKNRQMKNVSECSNHKQAMSNNQLNTKKNGLWLRRVVGLCNAPSGVS